MLDAMVWRKDDEQEEKDRCGIGVVSEDSPSRFCKNTDKDNVCMGQGKVWAQISCRRIERNVLAFWD